MKDYLKMIQFDFVTSKPIYFNLLMCVTVLIVLASLLLNPSFSALLIPFSIGLFLPVQSISAKGDFNAIYGILPVPRKVIIRAPFIEYVLSAFGGELFTLLLLAVSNSLHLHRTILTLIRGMEQPVTECAGCEIHIALFLFACVFICYMRMMSDIFGHQKEVVILLVTLAAILAVFMFFITLYNRQILPSVKLPKSIGGKLLLALTAHAAAFGLSALFCEITVKKTANREL